MRGLKRRNATHSLLGSPPLPNNVVSSNNSYLTARLMDQFMILRLASVYYKTFLPA